MYRKRHKPANATKLKAVAKKQGERPIDFFDDPDNDLPSDDSEGQRGRQASRANENGRARTRRSPSLEDLAAYSPEGRRVLQAGHRIYRIYIIFENGWPSTDAKGKTIPEAYAAAYAKLSDVVKRCEYFSQNCLHN